MSNPVSFMLGKLFTTIVGDKHCAALPYLASEIGKVGEKKMLLIFVYDDIELKTLASNLYEYS